MAAATQVLTPGQMAWLVQQGLATEKATNVTSESLLEVVLDLEKWYWEKWYLIGRSGIGLGKVHTAIHSPGKFVPFFV